MAHTAFKDDVATQQNTSKAQAGENTFGAFIQFYKGSIFGTRRGGGTGTTYRLGYHVLSLVTILVGYIHTISEN